MGDEVLYWIWLARACGVASKDLRRLVEKFESPFEIYLLDPEQIEHIEGIKSRLREALCNKSLEEAYSILRYCKEKKIDVICYSDSRYPTRLRRLDDPPALLFCKGRFPDFNSRLCIAVVGTRKMSEYGKQSAYKIAYELASANAIVVSGMALGVDAVAAAGALGASGTTVAVLGCGIDVVYPAEHRKLSEKIAKSGAVISEFMPSERPERYNFPKRNRIISGLCQGTLVVEGAKGSGALITARTAIAQGRELFALPGKINESNSEGPNELIRDGAIVALSSDDIIAHYDFLYHDAINYKAHRKSKRNSELDTSLIRSLHIGAKTYAGEALLTEEDTEATPAQADNNTKNEIKPAEEKKKETDANIEGLDESLRRVLLEMPIDSAVYPDTLVQPDMTIGDVITALTMLELQGLVGSLPGGLYIRK